MSAVRVPRTERGCWAEAADPLPGRPLRGRTRAHVVVVGAGLAGLSAAYHLVRERPDLSVVVLDSHRIGSGATGHSTGIVRPGVAGTVLELCRRYGEQEAARLYALTVDAVALVRHVVEVEGIACDLERVPHLKLATTGRQEAALRREAAALSRLGLGVELYDGPDLARLAPVPARTGLCYPQTVQLDPLRLVRGLARALLARGVQIYQDSPVAPLTDDGREVHTPAGEVRADAVVVTANGYSPGVGVLRGQVLPLHTHVSATAPLTAEQLARLSWHGRRSFSDKRQVFDYCRLTRDDRVVFGGGSPLYRRSRADRAAGATDLAAPATLQQQRAAFERAFPALADVPFTSQWSGVMGMTLDHLPVVGRAPERPDVVVCGGWNGHGLALSMASGAVVRDLVLDRPAPRLPWQRDRAPRLPPDPVRELGLRAYLTALRVTDRLAAAPAADRLVAASLGGTS